MSDLKPCPFCGTVDWLRTDESCAWWIECYECGGRGPSVDSEPKAIEGWNTRTDGWVTDRYPEEEGLYLVSIGGKYRGVRYYWPDGWDSGARLGPPVKYDAWQPLPPAYVPTGGEE